MGGSQHKEATRVTEQHFGKAYGGDAAENYERFFVPAIGAPLANELIGIAALRPGERVLDVACGTGVATRLAAERVGNTGAVSGLDLNPGMLGVARSVTPAGTSIQWYEASAEAMPLPDETFDVVLCQLSLQFFPDKPAALREMRRVLAPGGRLVLNVPGRITPIFVSLAEALGNRINPELAGFVHHVFSLHDPGELQSLATGAGFRDVVVRSDTRTLRLPAPEEFLWQYVHSTPLSGAVGRVGDDVRAALERDVVGKWHEFVEDGALMYRQDFVVATARR